MTEKKRFVIKTVEEDCIFDNRDCKYYDELDMTIALLNELNDENVQLRHDATVLIQANTDYRKENEQLKSELGGMEELLKTYRKTIEHNAELLADATKNGYLPPIKGGDFE